MLFTTEVLRTRPRPMAGGSLASGISYTLRLDLLHTTGTFTLAPLWNEKASTDFNARIPGVLWQGLSIFSFITCKHVQGRILRNISCN